jgi:hypothetical protein
MGRRGFSSVDACAVPGSADIATEKKRNNSEGFIARGVGITPKINPV